MFFLPLSLHKNVPFFHPYSLLLEAREHFTLDRTFLIRRFCLQFDIHWSPPGSFPHILMKTDTFNLMEPCSAFPVFLRSLFSAFFPTAQPPLQSYPADFPLRLFALTGDSYMPKDNRLPFLSPFYFFFFDCGSDLL